jgi:hypothetical protein
VESLRPVVSPEFELQIFCYRMIGKDPVAVMEAASAEIAYTKYNHRQVTRQANFRAGTKGRRYCEDLQELIRMLGNGYYPREPRDGFIQAVTPLMTTLLKNFRIGDLDKRF